MKIKLFLLFLVLIGLFYRLYGLNKNFAFWSDENTIAIFTRTILDRGKPILANGYFTKDQQLQYWLNALSVKIFGLSEFGVRFPSVFFGTLTILSTYFLGSFLFNRSVGFFGSLLIAFLKIEILWSRQARPYQSLQFLLILGAYFIYRITQEKKFNLGYFLGFLGCGVFATLMHGLGLVVFFSGFVYLLIFKISWFGEKWILLGMFLFVLSGWIFRIPIFFKFSQFGEINNLFYYRVFLTHNYLQLCLLALSGSFILIWRKKFQEILLFFIFVGAQSLIVSFFLEQPFTRYLYPVFPFIILLASYGILETGNWILEICQQKSGIKYLISCILILVVFYSLWATNKLSFLPQKVYSLNSDMQEIPEVDWKKIYGFVDQKLGKNSEAILVTNWNDFPVWYLGEDSLDYLVRNETEEKDIFSGAYIINSLDKFLSLVSAHKKGFFVLDSWDNLVPGGVREYCQNNLKLEYETDRLYPIQPRYWTVWVYSWGLDD